MIGTLVEAVAANRTRWRRARNLRTGTRTHALAQPRTRGPAPLRWLAAGCVLLAAAGAALIVVHVTAKRLTPAEKQQMLALERVRSRA